MRCLTAYVFADYEILVTKCFLFTKPEQLKLAPNSISVFTYSEDNSEAAVVVDLRSRRSCS